MAGPTARKNEKRKARYALGPARSARNKEKGRKRHIRDLELKLAHFERRVAAGKMAPIAFEHAMIRIMKEIGYCKGDNKRPLEQT